MATNVKVCCRFRPAASNESGAKRCVKLDPKSPSVSLLLDQASPLLLSDDAAQGGGSGKAGANTFNFDAVFDSNSKQSEVFDKTAQPFIKDVFSGYNTTIFACQPHLPPRLRLLPTLLLSLTPPHCSPSPPSQMARRGRARRTRCSVTIPRTGRA